MQGGPGRVRLTGPNSRQQAGLVGGGVAKPAGEEAVGLIGVLVLAQQVEVERGSAGKRG